MENDKKLKEGYTTGTTACAASLGACLMLIRRRIIEKVKITLPIGKTLKLKLYNQEIRKDFAKCACRKDSGDDPDVTDNAFIYAKVGYSSKGIKILGGSGVGIVTKPGLAIPVGEFAINPIPRKMVQEALEPFLKKNRGFEVTISVPNGRKLAKKTFNEKLGIIGGISILGTTGIVKPKSVDAYKSALVLSLDIAKAKGLKEIVLVPGNIGEKFAREKLGLSEDIVVQMGNFVGFMLKECVKRNFKKVLLIGHIGKLVKVAAGFFDTHSGKADSRVDTILSYVKKLGANKNILNEILNCNSAEATIEILRKNNMMKVYNLIAKDVCKNTINFAADKLKITCIIISLNNEIIGKNE